MLNIFCEVFYDHFKKLNETLNENTDTGDNIYITILPDNNDMLNAYFTVEEIKKTIKCFSPDVWS